MSGAVVDGLLNVSGFHDAVDEAGSEGIATAHAVKDLQAVTLTRLYEALPLHPRDRSPIVDGGGTHLAHCGADGLEVREGFRGFFDHLAEGFDLQIIQVLVCTFDLETERGGEVLLIADHYVNVLREVLVDFLRMLLATVALPERRTEVEIVRNNRPVFLRLGHYGLGGFGGLLRKRGVNTAGV